MASLQDLADRIKQEGSRLFEKIEETSLYQNLHTKFYSLNPSAQKAVTIAGALLALFVILSLPLSSFFTSMDTLEEFSQNRNLLQEMYKARQESQTSLSLPPPPSIEALRNQLEQDLKNQQLTAEQIKAVNLDQLPPDLPQDSFEGALQVQLAKLNVRQVVDLGYFIQRISAGIKIIDLLIVANTQDPRYFDVVYKIATLKIPQLTPEPTEEPGTKGARPAPGRKTTPTKKDGP